MKLAIVTCYKDPDYVRATVLRRILDAQEDIDLVICKNKHKGLLRYPEVIAKIIWIRIAQRPDTYLVTFRGYEILPFAAFLTWPRTLIYDELVNPLEWLREDRREAWAKFIPQNLLHGFYRLLIRRCSLVIADTQAHASYSAELLGLPEDKFKALPVGTDERVFNTDIKSIKKSKQFTVFYYGSMLPLHGLEIAMQAALLLKDRGIDFVFVGGGEQAATLAETYMQKGARITHKKWVPFNDLAIEAVNADLTLGGPFGDSPQAQRVVTGKTYQFLACGAPVLVGQNLSSHSFINKKNALTVPLGDPQALADQIEWAHTHPKQLKAIAAEGLKLYEKEFSNVALQKEMQKLLKAITSVKRQDNYKE